MFSPPIEGFIWRHSILSKCLSSSCTTDGCHSDEGNQRSPGDSIKIRWENGVFVPESGPTSFERIARDRDDEHRFLDLLAKYNGQGRKLSHKVAAKDYAPRVFAAEKGGIGSNGSSRRWSAYSSARKSTSRLTGQHLGAGHISRRGKIISVVSHFEKGRHNLINLASNLGPVARRAAVLVEAAQGLYR